MGFERLSSICWSRLFSSVLQSRQTLICGSPDWLTIDNRLLLLPRRVSPPAVVVVVVEVLGSIKRLLSSKFFGEINLPKKK